MSKIRILKKGKQKYYYIEHTIRDKNKFTNKRIYLGTELPKNIEKMKQDFDYEILEEMHSKDLNKIKNKFNREFSRYPESFKKEYIESFMIKFTYNTNKIEGSTLTLKETADLLQEQITPRNKPIRDVKETETHKKLFYEMLKYDKDLNLNTVLYWHKILFNESNIEIAGKIRRHGVIVGRSKVEFPQWIELDILLKEFFEWYNQYKNKLHPVLLAALVHFKFVSIHPFSDGNGRTSRIMMNFILHKNNYPMLNIEYKNRMAYYNALEKSQLNEKDFTFCNFLIKQYIDKYVTFLNN